MQGIFRIARHVAFIALVARALVPAGWMPDARGLTICSAQAPAQQQDHQTPAERQARHDMCPFSGAPHLASTPDAPGLALPASHAFAAATGHRTAAAIAARFAPHSPRAPPQNA